MADAPPFEYTLPDGTTVSNSGTPDSLLDEIIVDSTRAIATPVLRNEQAGPEPFAAKRNQYRIMSYIADNGLHLQQDAHPQAKAQLITRHIVEMITARGHYYQPNRHPTLAMLNTLRHSQNEPRQRFEITIQKVVDVLQSDCPTALGCFDITAIAGALLLSQDRAVQVERFSSTNSLPVRGQDVIKAGAGPVEPTSFGSGPNDYTVEHHTFLVVGRPPTQFAADACFKATSKNERQMPTSSFEVHAQDWPQYWLCPGTEKLYERNKSRFSHSVFAYYGHVPTTSEQPTREELKVLLEKIIAHHSGLRYFGDADIDYMTTSATTVSLFTDGQFKPIDPRLVDSPQIDSEMSTLIVPLTPRTSMVAKLR